MTICEKIDLDFVGTGIRQKAYAVQGDSYARTLEIAMHENGVAWNMPVGASAFLRYRKPDGTGGMYDTLPDGTRAWSAQGNRVNFILAPQVLSVPGIVRVQMEIISGKTNLATFAFLIEVEADPSNGVIPSEDYTSWNAWAMQALENLFPVGDSQPDAVPALWFDTTPGTGTQMTVLDRQGYGTLVYPITKQECVEGLTEALAGKAPLTHANSKENPHGVTAAQVGAAPVGYGLGGTATWIPDADSLKGYNANGWYYWSASNTDPDKPFGAGSMLSIRRSLSYWTQVAFEDGSYTGGVRVRKIIDGNAQPWEWVNPPMVVGVEYRTIERWKGKAVYTKTVSLGTVAAGENTISLGIPGITAMCGLELTDSNNFCVTGHPNIISAWATPSAVVVNAQWAQGLYATLKYTKD